MSVGRRPSISRRVSFGASPDVEDESETTVNESLPTVTSYFMLAEGECVSLLLVLLSFLKENQGQFASAAEYMDSTGAFIQLLVGDTVVVQCPQSGCLLEGVVTTVDHDILSIHTFQAKKDFIVSRDHIVSVMTRTFPFVSYFSSGLELQQLLNSNQPDMHSPRTTVNGSLTALGVGIAVEDEVSDQVTPTYSFAGTIMRAEIAMHSSLCTTAHLLRVLCYALSSQSSHRLASLESDSAGLLQPLAEICTSLLVCHLVDYLDPRIIENLELILRALIKYTDLQTSLSPRGSGAVENRPQGFFFDDKNWVEFCAGVVKYLLSVGITDRAKIQKTPEKSPVKK
jgi:hypothetical protein